MLGYSPESTQRELSNEYQHDMVKIVFKNLCDLCALGDGSLGIGRVDLMLTPNGLTVQLRRQRLTN